MDKKETSTFTVHHDRCDPSQWTVHDWKALADFVRTGDLSYAAQLSRLGMQLVLSDKHEPTGGTLENIGWAVPDEWNESSDDLGEIVQDDLEVTEVVDIYRGPTRYAVSYAVSYGIGDSEGNYEGSEIKVFDTAAEAEKFVEGFRKEVSQPAAAAEAPDSAEGVNHG